MKKTLGLYIHIPFCLKKCLYCGFLSFADKREFMEAYVESLLKEIGYYKKQLAGEFVIDTVFFGGGTPTLLETDMVKRLLGQLDGWLSPKAEITMEANPKTFNRDKLIGYMKAGVNRLSIGCQSLDDQVLSNLGRVHNREEFLDSFAMAREAGFDNINVDLMFAVPGQTMEIWQKTLGQVIDLEPEHISFYSLQIEENTPFYNLYKMDKLDSVTDEEERRMHHTAIKMVKDSGYDFYEISNCGKPGKRCNHNLKYWNMDDYLGVGLGASSFINGVRFKNCDDLETYLKAGQGLSIEGNCMKLYSAVDTYCQDTVKDLAGELVFTGLRKRHGFTKERFRQVTGRQYDEFFQYIKEEREKNIKLGFLVETDNRVYITEEGIDHSNDIMSDFV